MPMIPGKFLICSGKTCDAPLLHIRKYVFRHPQLLSYGRKINSVPCFNVRQMSNDARNTTLYYSFFMIIIILEDLLSIVPRITIIFFVVD